PTFSLRNTQHRSEDRWFFSKLSDPFLAYTSVPGIPRVGSIACRSKFAQGRTFQEGGSSGSSEFQGSKSAGVSLYSFPGRRVSLSCGVHTGRKEHSPKLCLYRPGGNWRSQIPTWFA